MSRSREKVLFNTKQLHFILRSCLHAMSCLAMSAPLLFRILQFKCGCFFSHEMKDYSLTKISGDGEPSFKSVGDIPYVLGAFPGSNKYV